MLDDDVGAQLVGWGKVVRLQTRGRVTGRPVEVAIGYVEEPDGSLLVAAGQPDADWALNLEADPSCRVTIGEATLARHRRSAGRPGCPARRPRADPALRHARGAAGTGPRVPAPT